MEKEIIISKRKELNVIGEVLKGEFFGIDLVIDEIIKAIETWYIFDEVLYVPTSFNLWGMTGTGKTTLIRRLNDLLQLGHSLVEIDVSIGGGSDYNYTGSFSSDISGKIMDAGLTPSDKFIVLIDEFDKLTDFKESGPIWRFLDSGLVASKGRWLKELRSSIQYMSEEIERYVSWVSANGEGDIEDENGFTMRKPTDPFIASSTGDFRMTRQLKRTIEPVVNDKLIQWIFNQHSDRDLGYYTRRDGIELISSVKEGRRTYMDILSLPNLMSTDLSRDFFSELIDRMDEFYTTYKGRNPLVMSKALIFIVGNLDELYVDASNIDLSADELHERTSKLTDDDLKRVLLKKFKPELVAKLSRQIIYPSIDEESFRKVIRYTLGIIEEDILSITDVNIKLMTDSNVDYIYNECVVPSQGIRPTKNKIFSLINNYIPKLVERALISGEDAVLNL